MKKFTGIILFFCLVTLGSFAHFQMIYTPSSMLEEGTSVDFRIVFTHPAEAGHTMDIGKNEAGEMKGVKEFFSIHKGEKTDLLKDLKKTEFMSLENKASAYNFTLNKDNGFKGPGDWVLVLVPHPYYEGAEETYIQQITKVMINKGEMATDWSERCADKYPEILPLVKPYDVWVGGVFRGVVVDSKGKPVANAEIEVEYLNYDIDMNANKFTGSAKTSQSATVILTDKNGCFSFVPTKEGYWGFAALGVGRDKKFAGKELSQDAVLWIEATKAK
ncbi:DUF4198 domain-containing protein [Treponema pedis]|uniref:DUF4198 domain-containing protein n=2 Tax=Treponema pedis TaxID=409322 RepID=S5ZY15_9SPIR|nr:DUF4198 domain-containing protein [Treponema pedis]AGT42878.1 hypothetical protein TPE_0382 [Treponema pedis str. T A4]QOW61495.1 DUF4198 domain-containing protein [Treponema pedis]QSI03741.1 DUF4198 domain-containing protein [Treponema pedis]